MLDVWLVAVVAVVEVFVDGVVWVEAVVLSALAVVFLPGPPQAASNRAAATDAQIRMLI